VEQPLTPINRGAPLTGSKIPPLLGGDGRRPEGVV